MHEEVCLLAEWAGQRPIASFGYFRAIVDEVAQMDTSPEYWRYISESLDKYERAWLAQSTIVEGAFRRQTRPLG